MKSAFVFCVMSLTGLTLRSSALVAEPDVWAIHLDRVAPAVIPFSHLLSNDSGDGLQVTGFNGVESHLGSVVMNADHFLYTQPPGFVGHTTFNYEVTSSSGRTAEAEVFICHGRAVRIWGNGGDPEKRMDMVLFGEGFAEDRALRPEYIRADLDYATTFDELIQGPVLDSLVHHDFADTKERLPYVFTRYRDFCNFYQIDVISNVSGWSSPGNDGSAQQTVLDSVKDPANGKVAQRAAYRMQPIILQLMELSGYELEEQYHRFDWGVRIKNASDSSGPDTIAGWGVSRGTEIMNHEGMHSWFDLADEYNGQGVGNPENESPAANITHDRSPDKWDQWVGYDNPYDSAPPIGYFPGGGRNFMGTWKPIPKGAHAVKDESRIHHIYHKVDVIDSYTDNRRPLLNPERLSIDTPGENAIKVDWYLNDVLISKQGPYSLEVGNLLTNAPGTYRVRARVYDELMEHAFASKNAPNSYEGFDPLDRVRTYLDRLERNLEWTVVVDPSGSIILPNVDVEALDADRNGILDLKERRVPVLFESGSGDFLTIRKQNDTLRDSSGWLQFDLQGITDPIRKVFLNIYAWEALGAVEVYAAGNQWDRSTPDARLPDPGALVGSTDFVHSRKWYSIDVTDYVTGNGRWSVMLRALHFGRVHLGREQHGVGAYLNVVTAPDLPPGTGLVFSLDQLQNALAQQDYAFDLTSLMVAPAHEELLFAKESGPGWLNVSSDGLVSGHPQERHVGPVRFSVKVTDAYGGALSKTFVLHVQRDADQDGIAESIDVSDQDASLAIDFDGDGVDNLRDAFPADPQESGDRDGDGVGDLADRFPDDANEQYDADADGIGDGSDPDDDNDGFIDARDLHIPVVEDAHVVKSRPNGNYGAGTVLNLFEDGSRYRNGFLKFDLTTMSYPMRRVRLYLHSIDGHEPVDVYEVADSSWSEETISWDSAPALGSLLGRSQDAGGGWSFIDLTGYITGNDVWSVGLGRAGSRLRISSRESEFSPYLEIIRSGPVFTQDVVSLPELHAGQEYTGSIAPYVDSDGASALTFSSADSRRWINVENDGSFSILDSSGYSVVQFIIQVEDAQGRRDQVEVRFKMMPDLDGDGILDYLDDDVDGDGWNNDIDKWPYQADKNRDNDNDYWFDTASDVDVADPDDDNDGVLDVDDAFPLDPSEWDDADGDGIGSNADLNDDNDHLPDDQDTFPLDPNEWADLDGDGYGDNLADRFPLDPNEWADSDDDGIGDNQDQDLDGDGYPNAHELNLGATDDTYIEKGKGRLNVGDRFFLELKEGGQQRIVYLKFNVNQIEHPVTQVLLHLHARNVDATVDAFRLENGWREMGVRWNTRLALHELIGSGYIGSEGWYSIDLTGYIDSNGTYSMALRSQSTRLGVVDSREAEGFGPYLEIRTSPDSDGDGLLDIYDDDDDGDGILDINDQDMDNDGLHDQRTSYSDVLEDSSLDSRYKGGNHGSKLEIALLGGNVRNKNGILKFDLSELDAPAAQAWLWLRSKTHNTTVEAYEVNDSSWDETTVTWNNAPSFGAQIQANANVTTNDGGWFKIDLSGYVTQNQIYTIGLKTPADALCALYSRESQSAPYLTLELAEPPDSDGDGMTDREEALFGSDPTRPDSDRDGFEDRHEYIAGTDPQDPADYFGIAGKITNSFMNVQWQAVPGRRYTLFTRENLTTGSWQRVRGPLSGRGPSSTTITNLTPKTGFYIMDVEHP